MLTSPPSHAEPGPPPTAGRLAFVLVGVLAAMAAAAPAAAALDCPEDAPVDCGSRCCPAPPSGGGTACCTDGSCRADGDCGAADKDVSRCDENEEPCGDYCMASGRVCCASVGWDTVSCPPQTLCHWDGSCRRDPENTEPGTQYFCTTLATPPANCSYARYCANDACRSYYEADGGQNQCADACDGDAVAACYARMVQFCERQPVSTGDSPQGGDGCVVAGGGGPRLRWLLIAGLAVCLRRRRFRESVCVFVHGAGRR